MRTTFMPCPSKTVPLASMSEMRLLVTSANAPDATAVDLLGAHLLRGDMALSGSFFAVGSLLFCYLFLRGRMIPGVLAWLGVIASLLLVVVLPLQLGGFLTGPVTSMIWMPMIVFEVVFALWLIIKGAARPSRPRS